MCSNYVAVTRLDRLLSFFGVEPAGEMDLPTEVYPLGLAPFIRLAEEGSGNKVIETGQFGLLPFFAKELAYGRRTYNARSETVDTLPSFRDSWAKGRRCIIPAECVFEPCYESGKAVRWCIQQPGQVPMGIAGIYFQHKALRDRNGKPIWSFAMLTVNADGHPVFQRMHKPGDEKRMVAILDQAEYDRWLLCSPAEAKTMCKQWMGPLDAFAAPVNRPSPKAQKPAAPPNPQAGLI
jgi:putative SOS response-associated peptidase YedK